MRIRINDVEIFYRDRGAGLPILFVHGFPLDGALWQPQLDRLSDTYRVIVPDLRGFGDSAQCLAVLMKRYADDLRALLDELEIERVVLAGLSMGGYVAFAFYRQYPNRVRGLVLVDTRPQADTEEDQDNRVATAERVRTQGPGVLADDMVEKLLSPATLENRPDVARMAHKMMARQSITGIIAALYGMSERPDSRPMLGEISAPALVVVGADDTVTPVGDAEAMVEAIPGAELAVIADAGHLSNLEQPEAFNRALREFLDSRVLGD